MKKLLTILLSFCLILSSLMMTTGCAKNEAVSEIGTWEKNDILFTTIEQGKTHTDLHSNLTLFSDNTYECTSVSNSYYSSDGGESFYPVCYITFIFYGKYESIGEDAALNERTIKLTSVDRVVCGEYDTAVNVIESDKELMKNSSAVGQEIILGADHKLSDHIPGDFLKLGDCKLFPPEWIGLAG